MLVNIIAYAITLVVFAAVDITWLMTVSGRLFRETLGDILLADIRMAPAVAFYLLYPLGLVIFGVAPALKSGSPIATALLYGGLFGLFAYATYDLTNLATLRNWTLKITLIDVAYGAAASALTAALAVALTPLISGMFNAAGR